MPHRNFNGRGDLTTHYISPNHDTTCDIVCIACNRQLHATLAIIPNLTFTPRNSRKTAIIGPDFDGT